MNRAYDISRRILAVPRKIPKRLRIVFAAALCAFAIAASAAYSDVPVYYWWANTEAGYGGKVLTVVHREYNDSCIAKMYNYSKSYYTLGNGNWTASIETRNKCESGSKAHLGPSQNYGARNVQSKCLTDAPNWLYCETSKP